MDTCDLPILISAISCAIAEPLDDNELALAVTIFTQIGDTLATILALRVIAQGQGQTTSQVTPEVIIGM